MAVIAPTRAVTTIPARFAGWGAAVPPGRVTNADLEQRMETSDEWIVERTGIRERRVAGAADTTAALAVAAGAAALDQAGVPAADVDLVVLATTTPDSPCPATASRVHAALGTRGAAFDVNAACAGFVHALHIGAAVLGTAGLDHVLVIGAERFTSLVDPADRATAVLFGDGAGAVLLGAVRPGGDRRPRAAGVPSSAPGVVAVDLGGDGDGLASLEVRPGERFIGMDGQDVFRRATRGMVGSCRAALERAGITADELAAFVPHQANVRIIDATANRLGIDRSKVVVNLERYGNTSAASVPMALAEAAATGRITAGDLVLVCGIGAGMAWATIVLRWGP